MTAAIHSSVVPASDHVVAEESRILEPGGVRTAFQVFAKLDAATSESNQRKPTHASKRKWTGPLGRSAAATYDSSSPPTVKGEEELVKVGVLLTQDTGYYKITPSTTFLELRAQIATRLGHSNFGFQDWQTKKSFASEDRLVRSFKQPITVATGGMDNLLADATFQGGPNTTITREGAAFRVFWWDSLLNTRRLVWLRMEPHRLIVSNAGSYFKLFDANGLRNPLVFAGVKGSDKGFQLVKGGSRLASRFYAQSLEQKQLISIYFCFVWRPNAVRRGWLPRADLEGQALMENGKDALDARQFANLLRRHMIEVDRVVQEIERSMDSKLVHYYIALFAQMFTGGYALGKDGPLGSHPLSNSELQSFGKASKLMQDWQEKANRNKLAREQRDRDDAAASQGKYSDSPKKQAKRAAEAIDFDEFFDEAGDPFDFVASMSQALSGDAPPPPGTVGPDGIPLPPPPPPPPGAGPLVQRPPICPINFDGISANDISGTIWADMSSMNLKEKELRRLENYLQILFGRDARERSLKKEESADGIIETGRLRNLEVLLFMEELKGLSHDELIDLILNFDNRIFCPAVLERLVRKVSKEDAGALGPTYAFLPSSKESESLVAHHQKHGKDTLRPGELFFLELTHRVPDRMQRFEFGYFMSKVDNDSSSIEEQLTLVEEADRAVRASQRFKAALKIILDILNTLMPRFGLTRGFRISSFVSSVDRVSGTVSNPSDGRGDESNATAEESLAPYLDPALPEAQRKKLLKLATLRKKIATKDADSWKVNLNEFISIFMNRFEVCQGFWTELMDPCESAMRVDQGAIEMQTADWVAQIEVIRAWYEDEHAGAKDGHRPRDAFYRTVGKFLERASHIEALRKRTMAVRAQTESLWKWLGEVMGPDPSLIFKYIHDLSEVFMKQWKALEAQWDHRRTLVLRGALRLEKPPASSSKRDSADHTKPKKKSKTTAATAAAAAAAAASANSQAKDSKILQMQRMITKAAAEEEEVEAEDIANDDADVENTENPPPTSPPSSASASAGITTTATTTTTAMASTPPPNRRSSKSKQRKADNSPTASSDSTASSSAPAVPTASKPELPPASTRPKSKSKSHKKKKRFENVEVIEM